MTRTCEWCLRPLKQAARRDTKTCSQKCRQAKARFRVGVAPVPVSPVSGDSSETRQFAKFAYADPPYPGLARKYYGPDAREVNHRLLIGTLMREYPDGWALSTSAAGLREVLPLCPPEIRLCSWLKGSQSSVASTFHSAWEPLIIWGGRRKLITADCRLTNTLVWGGRQNTHPNAIVGMKPAAFCEWMFRLLGAERQDSMTDIFPGSGAVSRAWNLYTSRGDDSDPSHGAGKPSRLQEAQDRLTEQLDSTDGPTLKLVPSE